jgi:hypothetical protein
MLLAKYRTTQLSGSAKQALPSRCRFKLIRFVFKEAIMMLIKISNEEANTLSAYEPIDSEFRTQAYKKWRNPKVGISTFGPRRRQMKPDDGILTQTGISKMGIEDINMIFDYFPLDELDGSTPALSFAPRKQSGQVSVLSILQRASTRLRKSFHNRCSIR